jgi:aminoglycoside phosphotransferase (APT) family kinase protein
MRETSTIPLPSLHAPLSEGAGTERQIAEVLRDYLRARLGVRNLTFAVEPVELLPGWETYTYEFQLHGANLLPESFIRPLILRIFFSAAGIPRARREIAAELFLARSGYPVPEPFLLEEDCAYFGGPFEVRAKITGQSVLTVLHRRPWALFPLAEEMADLHARLHQLPAGQFPAPAGSFLDRSLAECAETLRARGLSGLHAGLEWLAANRPALPEAPRLLHLDFHPLNLIQQEDGPFVVLDWSEADVGDFHADLATTLMLMTCVPPDETGLWERFSTWTGRYVFLLWYLRAYRQRIVIDEDRLSYYRAWAAFRRLCLYGNWICAGPGVTGYKPSALEHLCPEQISCLEQYFHSWSGTPIWLE